MNSIITLFHEQVSKNGAKTAVAAPDGRMITYSGLDENARRVAAKLLSDGLKTGESVLITASRGIGFVEAIFGILYAGGAYVPLSDHYPEDRTEFIKNNCGAKSVIDDTFLAACADIAPIEKPTEVRPGNTALIMYTSGSTGKPKGIIHSHSSLKSSTERIVKAAAMVDSDICAVNAPFYFVAHIVDMLTPLCVGMTAYILPDEVRTDPVRLAEIIDSESVTVAYIAPKVLRYFEKKGSSLRIVLSAGERMSQIAPEGFRLLNMYGMSETAGIAACFEVNRGYDNTPIGKPADGVDIYLLDEDGNDGDEGEICVSGDMGRGYVGLPEQTAQTFTPNPFREKDGHDILIHTGDLGKRLPDGNILYINRRDWMIKINGQRVEPGEIEAEIRRTDGIKDAVVKDFIDSTGQTFLAAYYIAESEIGEDIIKAALSEKLPEYMIPAYFTRLEKFPVNANGKLDRGALPMPEIDRRRAEYIPPENERQRHICEAFGEILGIADIGINDDFFSLGGDSIKVLMLQKTLRNRGVEISASSVFDGRTPENIAESIGETSALSAFKGTPADSYPLTKAQMSIYLDCQASGKETAYNNVFALFMPSDMGADEVRLKDAAESVLNGCPILGAVTKVADGMPSLVPSPDRKIIVEVRDTDLTDKNALAQSINTPFGLESELPTRAALFRTPEGLLLVLVMHHIVCDGTTASVIINNIASVYNGEAPAAEEMSNFTLAQYEASHPEISQADDEVYRKMLDQAEGDTELYSDDYPELADFKGKLGVYDTTLYSQQTELSGKLISALSEKHLTESTLFMSAYAYMLRLFCNQKNVLFFTGENGRHDPVLQNTIGMLVHNLPVLAKIDENAGCADFMTDVQKDFHDLVTHDGADIASLCGEYGIHPDCFFVYQGEMLSGVTMDGRYIPMEIYQSDDVMASLTLHVLKQNSGDYVLKFEYAAEKFAAETIKRMAQVYTRIVAGLCEGGKLKDIRLVSDGDIAEMETFNATEADYPVTDIVSMFRAQAAKTPDRTAVIFKDETLTYAQVDDISERIAGKIRSLGIGKGDVVSVLIPRCTYMTTASLGVLKSGAAYQPLDPSYPTERLAFMMSDASAKLLIADEELLSRVPEYKGEVLLTKDIPALPDRGRIKDHPDPSDLFILLYTSGSTGTPKGVMLEHRNIANFCAWYREFYHLDETSRVAAYASYGFDADMMDQYPALTTGACVYIIEEEIRLDLLALEARINEWGITHAFMTTQVGRQFYTMTNTEKLKYLSTGGEKLVPLPPRSGDPAFYNLYGPTECTIVTTAMLVDRLYGRLPIGKPLKNYKCYVIDENGRRLPPLIPGELLIAGRGVGRGYLNRPDLTEKVFIRNPFDSGDDYARAYRSGDIVRLLPNGEIDFIGRNDGQVKVRGFRIELTEVESVIREFPGIRDATVQAFEDEASGEKFIAAYVVADDIVDISALNEFILDRKPPYMVPAVTMQIESIPLNQNQKVNKKALPKPQRQSIEIIPPQNDVQQKIFDCIAEVVGHTGFGITTNIYEAGLSSIGAIRLNVLLFKAFDIPIRIQDLGEHRTVCELEAFFSVGRKPETYDVRSDYPVTQTQNGIFVECMNDPDSTVYNIPALFRLSDKLDTVRLKKAVEDAINAHPYVKTELFLSDNGEVRAKRLDESEPVVDIIETGTLPDDLVRPFLLTGGRLYRADIYKTADGNYLYLEFHHIIFDGTSLVILINDISSAYNGEKLEKEVYTCFEAALEEERAHGGEYYQKAKKYYDSIFDGMDTDHLPIGDAEESSSSRSSGQYTVTSQISLDNIKAFCENNGVTLNAFFNSVFAFVLSKYNNKPSALYTTVYNGRSDSRLSRAVSMFVKTFPVYCEPKADRDIPEFVKATGEQIIKSMENDIYSFVEISRAYNIKSDVLFSYQGDNFSIDNICGEKAEMIPLELSDAKAPLHLNIYIESNKVKLECEYRRDRYTETFAKCLIAYVEKAAEEFTVRNKLGDVSLLTYETERMLDNFNATEADYPVTDIVSMFRAQAAKTPDRTAVIFKDETLTYAQVDDISERIAGKIRSLGIGKGDVVSVLIPRCTYMTTASLGVLKSGAAYQPLDPSYPTERLAFMMSDASAKLLIADEELLSRVPEYKGEVLLTKDIPALPDRGRIKDHPDPSDLFILLYTSGSTGTPKGVMLEHRNIANFCAWYREFYHLDETSRVAAYASYGFDADMMDQYPALTTGACVYIIEEEIRLDLLALEARINEWGITHAFMTTQVGRQFYTMTNTEKLKYLSTGGEKLVPLPPRSGDPAFYNLYGPTECTIVTTAMLVDRLYGRLPIGKPLKNYKCYVIDENGRRLPPLIPGELLIAGRGVGRGYLNRPDLTEKVFIRNPFDSGDDYARAYRSGDIVRLLPNGEIDFIGRNDGQVKVRGFRIELTEVESVIREFPGIRDATVQAFEDEASGEKFIAAYVVADDIVDISALNEFILDRKPPYMVPAVTMQIESIPLNQNQKVNKKALPKPQRQSIEIIPPQNDVQQKIFDCIAEVVGHTGFGITTNIYEAGLSSIGAIKLNVLLAKAFDTAVTSRDLKENNTIDKLETFLTGAASGSEKFGIQPDYGLTKTQEGIYVECIAKPSDTLYNIPLLLEISDDIDTVKLKTAIVAAVNAHPILKTRLFINDDGDVRMRRMDGDFSFDESSITEREISSIEEEREKLVKPFKLLGGRLFRVEILHGGKTWLFIEMHHIISDGSSIGIFLNDVSAAYEGIQLETESYSGYEVVLNEEKLRMSDAYGKAKNYYKKLVDGAETQSLPTGDITGEHSAVTCMYEMYASGIDAAETKAWCENNKASMNGLFSAAFGLTLNKYLGTESAVFAGIYSGRNDSRLAGTVAMLVKTLPIVVSIEAGKTTAQLAREVSDQLVDSQGSDIYSFAEICRSLNVNADVMFAWQGDEFAFDTLCGKPAKIEPLRLSEAKAPMNLNVFIDGGKIRFSMEYRGDRYSEGYIRGFLSAVECALIGMVRGKWLAEVSILSEEAREMLDGFNDTATDGVFPTAPELFAKAAEASPDEIAVIARSGQAKVTYRELWCKAKSIANALIESGVRTNDRVALYMERDEDIYAVREGIMLSGGTFVSLEPEYPDDRILYILKDAGITRLITAKTLYGKRNTLFDGLDILFTDDISKDVINGSSFDLPVKIERESAAYLIYTSGSTGNPKGVEIKHSNLANLLAYNEKNTLAKAYVDNSTIFLALAAITFDVSVIEEMMPLYHGKAVSIATDEEIHNPLLLMRTVTNTGVDMMKCTPSYLQSILDVPEAAGALGRLKALIVGAEPFPAALYAKIRQA